MTHTKGPWSYHKFQSGYTIFGDGQYPNALPVAKTAADEKVGEADARLIAAAPALLEALKASLLAIPDGMTSNTSPICQQIRAALAAAEGREP